MTTGSITLSTIIQAEIATHEGRLPFSRFMALCLYHPTLGYYTREDFDLGVGGDFTTAAEISPLYAHCFAKQCHDILCHLPHQSILELGAGSGRFAGDLLLALAARGTLPEHYYIYEISPQLRKKQRLCLQTTYPSIADRVSWLDKLPTEFSGIILANEVLDALPFDRFHIRGKTIKECCVGIERGEFVWREALPISQGLAESAQELQTTYELSDGYESEINLHLAPFIRELSRLLQTGVMLLADYGYGQREYYHPERRQGTLTCFYQHKRHANPLVYPGKQDITAHVDFTRVIEAATAENGSLAGYTTQSSFLLGCGLIELAAKQETELTPAEQFNLHQAIKTLTLPTEMGERVKIMAISKNMAIPLVGFSIKDRSRDL